MIKKNSRYRRPYFSSYGERIKKPTRTKKYISDAILIAIFPIFAYLFAYIYTYGFMSKYHIPYSFLSLGIYDYIKGILLIISLSIFCFGLAAPFLIISVLTGVISNNDSRPLSFVFYTCLFSIVEIFLYYLFNVETSQTEFLKLIMIFTSVFNFSCCLILILLLFIIITRLLWKNRFKTFLTFVNKISKSISSRIEKVLSRPIALLGGYRNASILVIIILFLGSAYEIGIINSNSNYFYVSNTTPECVVLYENSEIAVCNKFDRKSKEVIDSMRIINLKENPNIEFSYEDIGPLHMKPTPSPTP